MKSDDGSRIARPIRAVDKTDERERYITLLGIAVNLLNRGVDLSCFQVRSGVTMASDSLAPGGTKAPSQTTERVILARAPTSDKPTHAH